MHQRLILGAALICATLATVAPADAPATQPSTTTATKPAADVTAVKRGSLSLSIDAQGSFEPIDPFEVRIRPKLYNGELTITAIKPNGSTVKKGDTLLELDSAVIKRMVAASDNDLLNARAARVKAEADAKVAEKADELTSKQQKAALKEAEDALTWFENVDGPQYLKLIDLNMKQFQDQVKDAEDELDQLKKMYKSEELTNATADIVVRRALRNLDYSKQSYAMMEERANKLRTFSYPLIKQRYVDGLETAKEQYALFETTQAEQKVQRKTGLDAVRAAEATAQLHNDELTGDLKKMTVTAPADGVLSYGQIVQGNWQGGDPHMLRVGERVAPQAVLMTLYTPGKLRLVTDMAESRYFAIAPGQKVSLSPVAFPELKYEGQCDPTSRTPAGAMGGAGYALQISTGEVDSRLAPGMKATIHMDVPLADDVLLVPNSAVSKSTVWVKDGDGKEESRHVLTGRSDGKSIEILSGVKEGDKVLTHAKTTE